MIDLHCHILPGLDDGPATMDGSLALARGAVADGTRVMVATPHVDHQFGVDPGRIGRSVEGLRTALSAAAIELEVIPGAEVGLTRLLDLTPEEADNVRLGDGPYVLLETPHGPADATFADWVLRLGVDGYRILLSHPERCRLFQREPNLLRRLVDARVLCAITAGSLAGQFGRTARRCGVDLLAGGLVHAVVSDAHDHIRRPPGVRAGLAAAERVVPEIASQVGWLVEEAPRAILAGEELPPRPTDLSAATAPRRRRRWWRSR